MSDLIVGKEARDAVIQGALKLAAAVECTLGPKGKNVVLYDNDKAYITKDGISIAKKVTGENPYEEAGIQILRQASMKTAEEAGDGTTTSIVLAKALLGECSNVKDISLPDLFKGMDAALNNFNSVLPYYVKSIGYEYESLKYIATTSTNNDEKLGEMIANAFIKAGPNGCVVLDKELHDYTSVSETNGVSLSKGCYNPLFFTDRIKQLASYKECTIAFYKGKVEKIQDLEVLYKNFPSPYVVVAEDFSHSTIDSMITNHYNGKIKFLPIMAEGMAESKTKCIEDLVAVVGCDTSSDNKLFVGKVKSITSSINDTLIEIYDNNRKSLSDLIKEYNFKIEKYPENAEYFKQRLAKLTGKLIVIKAGGATEVEAKEIKDRIEDAVCAVQAALSEGIVDGGGVTYKRIADVISNGAYRPTEETLRKGYDVVTTSILYPICKLCENSSIEIGKIMTEVTDKIGYNFDTNSFEDLSVTGIQDPAKVIRLALTNAISVVKALMTIECIIPNNN